jgi:allantoate deiminase
VGIEAKRLKDRLERLAQVGRTPGGGLTRLSYTPVYREAQALVGEWMTDAGLVTHLDAMGSLIGHRPGAVPGAAAIVVGSHIDTVTNGGRFDGTVGVLAGIEVAQAMGEDGVQLNHGLDIISFADEEGTRFGAGCLGSRAMLGLLPGEILRREDRDGVTLAEALEASGLDPARVSETKRDPKEMAAYVEMHIEQGAVLEDLGCPIGAVTGIAGPLFLSLQLRGKTDHAGATPMRLRRDALAGAAELILYAERLAKETSPTSVATVGRLEVKPGNVNAIPGEVFMTFDVRDVRQEPRDRMESEITFKVSEVAAERSLEYELGEMSRLAPVLLSPRVIQAIESSCRKVGVPVHELPSGAGHDAQVMASAVDTGMIFLRSKDGISHAPEEFTTDEDIELGTRVLLETVLTLDQD